MAFDCLSDDILGAVFMYVDPPTFFFVLCLVCKRFRSQETNPLLLGYYSKILKCQEETIKHQSALLQVVKQIAEGKSPIGEAFLKAIFTRTVGNVSNGEIREYFKAEANYTKIRLWCENFLGYIGKGPYSKLTEALLQFYKLKRNTISSKKVLCVLAIFWEQLIEYLGPGVDKYRRLRVHSMVTKGVLSVKERYPFFHLSKCPTLHAEVSFVDGIARRNKWNPVPLEIKKALAELEFH